MKTFAFLMLSACLLLFCSAREKSWPFNFVFVTPDGKERAEGLIYRGQLKQTRQ